MLGLLGNKASLVKLAPTLSLVYAIIVQNRDVNFVKVQSLFVCRISLTSGQNVVELFPDCTRSCFLQVEEDTIKILDYYKAMVQELPKTGEPTQIWGDQLTRERFGTSFKLCIGNRQH